MRQIKTLFPVAVAALAFFLLTQPAVAAVSEDDLPAGSTWYFHADFDEMKSTPAGQRLYAWVNKEVFEEIRTESGVDLAKEMQRVTAFATRDAGAVMVVDGDFSQNTRDKALAAAALAERFDTFRHGGKTYYHVVGDGEHRSKNVELSGVDNEFYFSFDVADKLVLAAQKEQLESLLDSGGRIAGQRGHGGALFVLSAESSLMQAGLDTESFGDEDGGFQSNIMRNTRQLAFLVADVAGKIAVEARLVANDAEVAQSLASIVRGLLALQAFSEDMDPNISQFLQNTRVDVNDTELRLNIALPPELVTALLDDA